MSDDPSQPGRPDAQAKPRETNRAWNWLLVVPFFGVFFPWIYNTDTPEFIGIPFFYWYQMAWVPIAVVITVVVYRMTTSRRP